MTTSTWATRWGLPLIVSWCQVLLSSWVYTEKIRPKMGAPLSQVALTLLGVPIMGLLVLLSLRMASDRKGSTRGGDLLILWATTLLFGIHAVVLAVALGMLPSLTRLLPLVLGVWFIGLAPIMARLEPGCPMGIQTQKTLSNPHIWIWVHQKSGGLLFVAGMGAFAGWWFEPLIGVVVVATVAMGVAGALVMVNAMVPKGLMMKVSQSAPESSASFEDGGQSDRPSSQDEESAST